MIGKSYEHRWLCAGGDTPMPAVGRRCHSPGGTKASLVPMSLLIRGLPQFQRLETAKETKINPTSAFLKGF